MANMKALLAS